MAKAPHINGRGPEKPGPFAWLSRDKGAPLVKASGVNHSFGQGESQKQVLFDNNLHVYPGEVVIMTGPSGSGKTTMLTLIGALRSLQEGSLTVMGKELMGLARSHQIAVRRNIGFIFQHHNLFEALTALQSVKLATEVAGVSGKQGRIKAESILGDLGLSERLHYKPQKLSGGQQQRVAIARALVNDPKLILADEPTAALDRDTGREVVEMFHRRAKSQGCSVLIVSHDNRILDVADRIISMVDGRVTSDVDVHEALELADILRSCPAFQGASAAMISDVTGQMKSETCKAGALVIKEGDLGDRFYVVAKGTMEVFNQKMGFLDNLGAGDFFGEIALLEEVPRQASVKAVTDCKLLSLSKAQFLKIVRECSSFEEQMRRSYFWR